MKECTDKQKDKSTDVGTDKQKDKSTDVGSILHVQGLQLCEIVTIGWLQKKFIIETHKETRKQMRELLCRVSFHIPNHPGLFPHPKSPYYSSYATKSTRSCTPNKP